MPYSRTEQALDKMRYDLHDIDKQLTRIADALERAYPKISKFELCDSDGVPRITITAGKEDATDEGNLFDRHPPIETVEKMW